MFTNIDQKKISIKEKIRPLIPLDDVNIDVYKDALDYAMENPKINNIALTSPYGGGKSSVIRSYEKKHNESEEEDKEFIYIPILKLDNSIKLGKMKNENENEIENENENEIERKIIEYLMNKLELYSCKNSQFEVLDKKILYQRKIGG